MTRQLLVRVPDGEPDPPGTIGRWELVAPRTYVKVADRAAFEAWAGREGLLAGCGHVPPAAEKLLRKRVAEAAASGPCRVPDGLQVRTDGVTRIRVWPAVVHAGERPGAFLWESPVLVGGGRPDGRKTRSQRRRRWRARCAPGGAGHARGAGSTRRSRRGTVR